MLANRTQPRSKTVIRTLLAASLIVGLAGCGGTPTSGSATGDDSGETNLDKISALPLEEQYDEAVKLAQEEGEVTVYGSITPRVFDILKEQFTAEFGIKVNDFRGKPEAIQQRVMQEADAGRPIADVIDTNFEQMVGLAEEGLLVRYEGPLLSEVDEAGKFQGWVATRFDLLMPAWNTDIIKPDEAPQSWEDLADPRFDGRMTLDNADHEWYGGLTLHWLEQGKSQSEIDDLWEGIASGTTTTQGHSTMAELLSAGQTGMDAMNYSYLIDLAAEKGAPVTYRNSDGTAPITAFMLPFGIGSLVDSPNSAAGWLFTHWMLSEDGGQAVFADSAVVPSTAVEGYPILDGVTVMPFPAYEVHEETVRFAEEFDALLRGVPSAG